MPTSSAYIRLHQALAMTLVQGDVEGHVGFAATGAQPDQQGEWEEEDLMGEE